MFMTLTSLALTVDPEMERSSSTLKQSIDSKKRLIKTKRPISSKTSQDVDEPQASIGQQKQVDAEQNTNNNNYRESITDSFFESFFSTLIVERKSIPLDASPSTINVLNPILNDSEDSFVSDFDKLSGSIYSKDTMSQKASNLSSQSTTESSNTNSSCLTCSSNCMCIWRVLFTNGNKYEGQFRETLMEGKGSFSWNNGSVYKGDFKDGYPCGQGKLILPDLSTYDGEFCMGFFHGNGTFNIKSSPMLYSGEWRFSKKNGKGWLLYAPDNWFDGDWVNNEKHGSGYRQYANGDKYKGNWLENKISGEGCMMWHNNDYYSGEWRNGNQHGYGEYTWNLISHDSFVFPNYNWYKGSWVDGQRTGAGVMSFGHESGAKLAGMWQKNKKNGAGVMVCGNGMILEKNPLFTDDKPSAFIKDESPIMKNLPSNYNVDLKESAINRFKKISTQVISRDQLEAIRDESLVHITKSGTSIKMKQYIKLLDKNVNNAPPLKIPIHNVIHEVDLEYFLGDFIRPSIGPYSADISTMEIAHIIDARTESYFMSPSCMNYLPSNADMGNFNFGATATASQQCVPNTIELRNLIINYLPQLRDIYKMYASLCVEQQQLSFEPVLVRLFLWQLYRDIGVTNKGGIPIVDIDEMLMLNPNSCLETCHNPWEPIYFWQFLQALVGVACLLYTTENHLDYTPSSGFMYYMFKQFLDHRLLLYAGVFQGNCLTFLRDLVPIDAVYRLYTEVGEPHTVEEFLKNTCLNKGLSVPCYKVIDKENNNRYMGNTGSNVVVLNNELSYMEKSELKLNTEVEEPKAFETLYSFSTLGRKKILKSLNKICPQLILPCGRYQLHYRLSFIEFYEAMLLLAFEKVELERLVLVEEAKHSFTDDRDVKSTIRVMSRMSTHSAKRKKFKK